MKDSYDFDGPVMPSAHEGNFDVQISISEVSAGKESQYASRLAVLGPAESGHTSVWYRKKGKRIADVTFVLVTLPFSLTLSMVCALALWLEGGQPFYRQVRLGKNGRRFSILKFRTMGRDADEVLGHLLKTDRAKRIEWETTQKLREDPRITRVGSILRSTSLDELPQLWNVLKGEMSVVGPRPMMPDQLSRYGNPDAYFALLPGITGEWQVSDRNESSFAYRSVVDTRYNNQLTFWSDLIILFKTMGVVMRRTGY